MPVDRNEDRSVNPRDLAALDASGGGLHDHAVGRVEADVLDDRHPTAMCGRWQGAKYNADVTPIPLRTVASYLWTLAQLSVLFTDGISFPLRSVSANA